MQVWFGLALCLVTVSNVGAQGTNKYYTNYGNVSGYCPIGSCSLATSGCASYQYLKDCGFNSSGTCTNCAAGWVAGKFFSSSGAGFSDACVLSSCTSCGAGSYTAGCTASSAGTCATCASGGYTLPANNYWKVPSNATDVCPYVSQTVSDPGYRTVGQNDTYPGTQVACPTLAANSGLFYPKPSSPTENCVTQSQLKCPAGQRNVGYSSTSAGVCQDCTGLANGSYYVNNTDTTSNCPTASCTDSDCQTGQWKSGCTGTSSGVCAPCTTANSSQVYSTTGGWSNNCQVVGCTKVCPSGQYIVGCGSAGATSTSLTCGSCNNAVQDVTFYNGQGAYLPNSCSTDTCKTCPIGYYRQGCGGTASGVCSSCNNTVY